MTNQDHDSTAPGDGAPGYRVRRVGNAPADIFRGRVYDVEATPAGAAIPAFRVRDKDPVGLLSATSWPSLLLTNEERMDEAAARGVVSAADRARWQPGGERRRGAWVSSRPGTADQQWPLEGAEARRALMDVQWVASWFRDVLSAEARVHAYGLVGAGQPGAALGSLAEAVRSEKVAVPRRYAFALERLGKAHGVEPAALEAVYEFVPEEDTAWAWAHTLNLPKIRKRWLTDETGDQRRLMEVECTPVGQRWPEWTKRTDKSRELIEPLLGREFHDLLHRRVLLEYDGGLYRWQSLFHEDIL
ncbi:hypothetical protein KRR55_17230 [Paeniglutamicibacter sp. ABSL32-1]|uniref:hypothetical protein n=1 Tax=Paeniglutamicibacter quisquiliarum TaxID=2849498 RepID=UPI001C2D60C4|nr:hypothetical protein [Paeniglutamicibacter quisquiliarum]MBV1780859.1 hypothetical protein [Paeniglutamicibacter quisquiliarum]